MVMLKILFSQGGGDGGVEGRSIFEEAKLSPPPHLILSNCEDLLSKISEEGKGNCELTGKYSFRGGGGRVGGGR
jgi:hypothetical protein